MPNKCDSWLTKLRVTTPECIQCCTQWKDLSLSVSTGASSSYKCVLGLGSMILELLCGIFLTEGSNLVEVHLQIMGHFLGEVILWCPLDKCCPMDRFMSSAFFRHSPCPGLHTSLLLQKCLFLAVLARLSDDGHKEGQVRHVLVDVLAMVSLLFCTINSIEFFSILGKVQAEYCIFDKATAFFCLVCALAKYRHGRINVLLESITAGHLTLDPV